MNETHSTQVTTTALGSRLLHQLPETLEFPTDRCRKIGARPGHRAPSLGETPCQIKPAIVTPDRLATWAESVARDASSADLVNFPFAIATYFTFVIGAAFIGWGAILDNLWLASAGFFTALVASVFYGLARHND